MKGKAWKFGDNVDTDVIMPGQYLTLEDPKELASHCLEGLQPNFAKSVKPGDIIVAGKNFGCGSSREPATQAIKDIGVGCVLSQSFARIFLRNAIAIGLPIMECDETLMDVAAGDEIEIDFEANIVLNMTNGKRVKCKEFPPFMREIIRAGGLVRYAKSRLEKQST